MLKAVVNYEGELIEVECWVDQNYDGRKGLVLEDIYNEEKENITDEFTEIEHDYIISMVEDQLEQDAADYEMEKRLRRKEGY